MATRKALCIGINDYPGTAHDLSGCVNDARDWKAALADGGYGVTLLLDDAATKAGMKDSIHRLVRGAGDGDRVVITYSGHGSWIPDDDGDEPDGRDEVLCPWDVGRGLTLSDDELHAIFSAANPGAAIVLISDSCHSGTVSRFAPVGAGAVRVRTRFLPPENFLKSPRARATAARIARTVRPRGKPNAGLLLAGCQDTEFSYDATFGGRPNGAFTFFALRALRGLPATGTYLQWFKAIRAFLPSGAYPQTPNLQGTKAQKSARALG